MSEGTLLDTFSVAVRLDPADFLLGQKRINEEFEKTKTNSKRTAGELEESGKQASLFFDEITSKALKLGTILIGGVGLKDFIGNSVKGGAALGFMAHNANISANQLTKWKNVVRGLGFDAEEVAPSLVGLSQKLAEIQLTGKDSSGLFPALQSIGITDFIDHATGQLKTVEQLLPEIHKGLTQIGEDGKPKYTSEQALALANRIGLSQGLTQALLQEDSAYQKSLSRAEKVSAATEEQTKNFQRLVGVFGTYEGALESTGYELSNALVKSVDFIGDVGSSISKDVGGIVDSVEDMFTALGKKFPLLHTIFAPLLRDIDTIGEAFTALKKHLLAIIGFGGGGAIGIAVSGVLLPFLGPLAPVAGAIVGAAIGGVAGNAADKTIQAYSDDKPVPTKPVTAPGAAPKARGQGPSNEALADKVYRIIGTLEGGRNNSITPTYDPKDPYAYGKNQITLETARGYDKNASPAKLADPAYNEALARKIEAEYVKRYGGNLDAIAIAYHNGKGAADKYVSSGGSTSGISNWGDQSQAYLNRERSLAAISGGDTTNNTTTTHIGTVQVAATSGDAKGIASGIRNATNTINQAPNGPS